MNPNHVVRYISLYISGNREAYTSPSQSKSNSRLSPVCGSACCLASYNTLSAQVRPWLNLSKGTIYILRYPNISIVWFGMTLSSHVHTTGTDTCPYFLGAMWLGYTIPTFAISHILKLNFLFSSLLFSCFECEMFVIISLCMKSIFIFSKTRDGKFRVISNMRYVSGSSLYWKLGMLNFHSSIVSHEYTSILWRLSYVG